MFSSGVSDPSGQISSQIDNSDLIPLYIHFAKTHHICNQSWKFTSRKVNISEGPAGPEVKLEKSFKFEKSQIACVSKSDENDGNPHTIPLRFWLKIMISDQAKWMYKHNFLSKCPIYLMIIPLSELNVSDPSGQIPDDRFTL